MYKELKEILESCRNRNSPFQLIGDCGGTAWRRGDDPHIHRGWEIRLSPHAPVLDLIPPRAPHCSAECDLSIQVSPVEVDLNCRGRWARFRLNGPCAQLNVLPELFAALERFGNSEAVDSVRLALAEAVLANLQLLFAAWQRETADAAGPAPDPVELGIDYIRRNYYRNSLGVEDVARFVGVTPQYLNALFRRSGHRSIRRSLVEIRLNRARELLEERSYLVGEVARLTGWSSPFYFCNRFRRHYGFPPQQLLK